MPGTATHVARRGKINVTDSKDLKGAVLCPPIKDGNFIGIKVTDCLVEGTPTVKVTKVTPGKGFEYKVAIKTDAGGYKTKLPEEGGFVDLAWLVVFNDALGGAQRRAWE